MEDHKGRGSIVFLNVGELRCELDSIIHTFGDTREILPISLPFYITMLTNVIIFNNF